MMNIRSHPRSIFTFAATLLVVLFLVTDSQADEHDNFVSEKVAQKFTGIWKVKRRGGSLLSLRGQQERAIWSIRRKNKKLILDIPEADVVFDNLKVKDNTLSQKIMKENPNGYGEIETSIEIEVVDGLFDGEFVHKDARIIVRGRYENLYRLARKAEKVFVDKLDAEKKRLGDGIKKLSLYENQIKDLKLKLKGMGSKEIWEKQKNNDLRNLRNQYKKKQNSLVRKMRNETNQLKNELNKERRKPPRVSVSRLPRDTQVYKTTDFKATPSREARSYFKVTKNQALIRLANLNNGWSMVATDRGDMGFVVTTHLRSVSGSIPPIRSSSNNNQGSDPEPAIIKEDKAPQLINLVYPKRGKGSKRNNVLIPAAGFVTLRGTIMGKVSTFTINGEKVSVGNGNSFRYLMDISEEGQIIKIFAVTDQGQQRLNLKVRIAS